MCLLRKVIKCLLEGLSGLIQGTLDHVILCVAHYVDLVSASAEKRSWSVPDGSIKQIAYEVNHGCFREAQLSSRRFYTNNSTCMSKEGGKRQDGRTIRVGIPRSLLVARNILRIGVVNCISVSRCIDLEHDIDPSLFRSLLNIFGHGDVWNQLTEFA